MLRWQVLLRYISRTWQDYETRRLHWFKQLIISHAAFYGGRQPPHIRWKATIRIINGGCGNRTVTQTGHLVWPAIGGAGAGAKDSTAPREGGRTRIVFPWNGAAFNPRLTHGTRMRWNVIAPCCAGCANAV